MSYYIDPALGILREQLKRQYPGIVIGWIGDTTHQTENPSSDHNPEPDGSVDAIDLMLGKAFTATQCQKVIDALVASKDWRIKYIIWNHRIIAGNGGIEPWKWRKYNGKDPHTGHAHISRNDIQESNIELWHIGTPLREIDHMRISVTFPLLREGDNDIDGEAGYWIISRMQRLVGTRDDGYWGPKTSEALGFKILTEENYRRVFGLSR